MLGIGVLIASFIGYGCYHGLTGQAHGGELRYVGERWASEGGVLGNICRLPLIQFLRMHTISFGPTFC